MQGTQPGSRRQEASTFQAQGSGARGPGRCAAAKRHSQLQAHHARYCSVGWSAGEQPMLSLAGSWYTLT